MTLPQVEERDEGRLLPPFGPTRSPNSHEEADAEAWVGSSAPLSKTTAQKDLSCACMLDPVVTSSERESDFLPIGQ